MSARPQPLNSHAIQAELCNHTRRERDECDALMLMVGLTLGSNGMALRLKVYILSVYRQVPLRTG